MANNDQIRQNAEAVANEAQSLADRVRELAAQNADLAAQLAHSDGHGAFLLTGLTIFVLACFVGYYVVWRVTPALHSPLMGITNAISSVIIVGAVLAAGAATSMLSGAFGFFAVVLASINIFGGFIVTNRMLAMFKKKK